MSVHASQKTQKEVRDTERERERKSPSGRETEEDKRGRNYTETYTYRELPEKLKGEKPRGETEMERSCQEHRPSKIVYCTKERRERLEHLQPVLHPMGKSMPHNISQI